MNRYRIWMDDGREFEIFADSRREAAAKLNLITNGRGTAMRIKEDRHG